MTTDTVHPVTTVALTDEWLTGDYYDDTADAISVGILRVRISELIDMVDPCVIYEAMRVVFGLEAITITSTSPDLTRLGLSNT